MFLNGVPVKVTKEFSLEGDNHSPITFNVGDIAVIRDTRVMAEHDVIAYFVYKKDSSNFVTLPIYFILNHFSFDVTVYDIK